LSGHLRGQDGPEILWPRLAEPNLDPQTIHSRSPRELISYDVPERLWDGADENAKGEPISGVCLARNWRHYPLTSEGPAA
jgi:hypothetical protein